MVQKLLKLQKPEEIINFIKENNFPLIIASLFFLSLILPALGDKDMIVPGYGILLYGWMGAVSFFFSWFANIFGILAFFLVLFKKFKSALLLTILTILISLQSLEFDWFGTYAADSSTKFYLSFNGLLIGFYMWELSFIFLFIFCLSKFLRKKFFPKLKI